SNKSGQPTPKAHSNGHTRLARGPSSAASTPTTFACPLCPKFFPQKKQLQRHMCMHVNIKPYSCRLPGCSVTSTYRDYVVRHIRLSAEHLEVIKAHTRSSGRAWAEVINDYVGTDEDLKEQMKNKCKEMVGRCGRR